MNFLKESQRVYNCLIQLFKQNILILQLSLKGQVTLKADLFQKHNLTDPRIFKDIICTLICILAFLRGNLFWMAWSYALSVMFLWWPIQLDFEMGKWMHKPVRWLLHCTVLLLYGLFISIFFFLSLSSCRASLMTIRTETSKGNVSTRTSWWVNTPCFLLPVNCFRFLKILSFFF